MNAHKFFCFILFLAHITIGCRQARTNQTDYQAYSTHEHDVMPAKYDIGELERMRWLTGNWVNDAATDRFMLDFHFGADNNLVAHRVNAQQISALQPFVWSNGKFYFGSNREWIVTWIGEKDVRFDAAKPGILPMTWTKKSDAVWYMVQHTSEGDKTFKMQKMLVQP